MDAASEVDFSNTCVHLQMFVSSQLLEKVEKKLRKKRTLELEHSIKKKNVRFFFHFIGKQFAVLSGFIGSMAYNRPYYIHLT